LPQRVPSLDDPEPPTHTLDTLRLPNLILEAFDVQKSEMTKHVWNVQVKIVKVATKGYRRNIVVSHNDTVVDESSSRIWHM
jgi:hypothetical protein